MRIHVEFLQKKSNFSFKNALKCDPISAFGGRCWQLIQLVSKKLALELNKNFFEVIISKGFKKDALRILKKKKI